MRRLLLRLPVALLATGGTVLAQERDDPAQAAAYIRVIGDVRAEWKRVYRAPLVRHDVELATGSGFVISSSGLILTNHHVVASQAQERNLEGEPALVTSEMTRIEAVIGAGEARRTLPAAIVADETELDLVVLSVTAGDLQFLRFGDSDAVEPGAPTRVLGFPFGRQVEVAKAQGPGVAPDVTVSAGRLGANRSDDQGASRYLQTDANVAPGSSGGPMLDAENYVVGVVRSKLARAGGPGFAIAINRVKDFLEDNGFLSQLPARRLRLLPPQPSPWKAVRLSAPSGIDDASRSRVRVSGGSLEEGGILTIDRVLSPLSLEKLADGLLAGELDGLRLLPRGAPTARDRRSLAGSATAVVEGVPVRVEYALVDLGKEKLVARFLATPDQVAFNLSVIRGALFSLEGERLLTDEVGAPVSAALDRLSMRDPRAPATPMPARFVTDETPSAVCPAAGASSLLSASPSGDFSVSFRVSFAAEADDPARECPNDVESTRLGVTYRSRGLSVRRPEGWLRFEAEAPVAKLRFIEELTRAWLSAAQAGGD